MINDYPSPAQLGPGLPALPLPDISGAEAGWLGIDFCKHPLIYTNFIREYCREDNTSVDFAVLKTRDWYHAPWMHASNNRRELAIRAFHPGWENWAIGFYNSPGASVFGGVWANPSILTCLERRPEVPQRDLCLQDPSDDSNRRTSVYYEMCSCLACGHFSQPETKSAPPNGKDRNDFHGEVRLIQGDFAVVFGTFMNHMNAPNAGTLAGKSARVIRIATDFFGSPSDRREKEISEEVDKRENLNGPLRP
ncbi:hypothetical protein B0H14DRAFT_2605085 [Mycena olivaceomarginata]|nr:hypothetical protein B0H14DRAFT_2605085 [Mycena olivaceomarginata]